MISLKENCWVSQSRKRETRNTILELALPAAGVRQGLRNITRLWIEMEHFSQISLVVKLDVCWLVGWVGLFC